MTHLRLLPLCLLLSTCAPVPVAAQGHTPTPCGPREEVIAHLETRYGETLRSAGLAGPTRIVKVYASDDTGSWTIAVTSTNGVMCLLASGGAFQSVAQDPDGAPT